MNMTYYLKHKGNFIQNCFTLQIFFPKFEKKEIKAMKSREVAHLINGTWKEELNK